ncbi:MAG: hypothetical protein M1839_009530 [Geoglossum umbratile]|nr:MAG: hypothetical protein M1839_009530 [Geoglossum umbratile]
MVGKSPVYASVDRAEAPSGATERGRRTSWCGLGRLGRAPLLMACFLLLGTTGAVLHHEYYTYLAGKPVRDHQRQQQWASRIGTALAFLIKTFLVSAVTTAYIQRIWTTMKDKEMSVKGLNALFQATSDVTSFFRWEMISRAKVGTIVALISWLIPLASVVTPSTLSIKGQLVPEVRRTDILMPNFTSAGSYATFFFPGQSQNQTSQSGIAQTNIILRRQQQFQAASNYAAVLQSGIGVVGPGNSKVIQAPTKNWTYVGPGPSLIRLATMAMTGGSILPIHAPGPNATYALTFPGPSLKCDYTQNNRSMGSSLLYAAFPPSINAPWEVQILIRQKTTDPAKSLTCRLNNASYSASFNFTNNAATGSTDRLVVRLTNITANAILPNVMPHIDADATRDASVGGQVPKNTTSELDLQTASYKAMLDAFVGLIGGNLSNSADEPSTLVLQTNLANGPDLYNVYGNRSLLYPNLTLKAGLEELWTNLTISLFAASDLFNDFQSTRRPVEVTLCAVQNVFAYDRSILLIAYCVAIAVTILSISVGLTTCFRDGGSYSGTFSRIVKTNGHPEIAGTVHLQFKKDEGSTYGEFVKTRSQSPQ